MRHEQNQRRYNEIVTRRFSHSLNQWMRAGAWLLLASCLCVSVAYAQETPPDLPPEEDETYAAPQEYSFNPLQARKELKVARFYMRKGSHRAAALRAQEAVKWDDSLVEAYILLGEAREKFSDLDGALKAYLQFLEASDGDAKERRDIQRRVERLKQEGLRQAEAATKPKP
ncbi:MAG: hypothetical protein MUF01_15405 [Bryobacterales bacterium]|jgi:tetratricopeptide (TPR) repeat protein|nr:hypothetical protein [Bryobacterales bacterium]